MRAIHFAILDKYAPNAAGYFASDGHAAVSVAHLATAHDDVLARPCNPASICVAAALDRNAVVAGIEKAVVDQNIGARFGIASVVVRSEARYVHITNSDVLAKRRVNL